MGAGPPLKSLLRVVTAFIELIGTRALCSLFVQLQLVRKLAASSMHMCYPKFLMSQIAVPKFVNTQTQSCEGRTLGVQCTFWNRDGQLAFRKALPSRGHVPGFPINRAELPGSASIATKLPFPSIYE